MTLQNSPHESAPFIDPEHLLIARDNALFRGAQLASKTISLIPENRFVANIVDASAA